MLKLYLDSSVILKRYITEPGTQLTDTIFEGAEAGEFTLTFSLWNIGEALEILDERRRKGWLTEEEFKNIVTFFADEVTKLMRLRTLEITPIYASILTAAWKIIINHHIYEADAIQITTCTNTQSDALISGDEKLIETGTKIGIKAFHITRDEQKIKDFIR